MTSKTQAVLQALIDGETVTELDGVMRFNTTSVAQIIQKLRRKGYLIKTDLVPISEKKKIRFARYSLPHDFINPTT